MLFDFVFDDDAQAFLFLDEDRVVVFGDQPYSLSKPVAAFGNGFDVPLFLPIVAQRPARRRDVLCQVVFFDIDIRPDNLD